MVEQVVLVNESDEVLGLMDKQKAHEFGILHRAFSVFLFNKNGEMILQKRALSKYHSPGLWTNACCSHPRCGETYKQAAERRLVEELGIETEIEKKIHFIYKANVGDGLWEHELDYVFTGIYDGKFKLNPDEVSEIRYVSVKDLDIEMKQFPEHFTKWFQIIHATYIQQIR